LLQILALLQKVDPTEVEEMVEIKEEPSDTPMLEGVLGEGKFSLIQLCNLCDASTHFLWDQITLRMTGCVYQNSIHEEIRAD
jgi:hypothetical protein